MSNGQTAAQWRRSETRKVRPFLVTKELARALDRCAVRLRPGDSFVHEESIKIPAGEVGRLEPTLRLSINQASLAMLMPAERTDLRCMVFLESGFLKRIDILADTETTLSESMDIDIPLELSRQLRIGNSSILSVALCLNRERPKSAGTAFHKGHWLAKKTFDLNVEKEGAAFSIEPLDDAVRKRFSLPPGSLYYIHYLGGLNEPVSADSPPAKVYVAKEVIDRLVLTTQQRNAATVEAMLAAEIAAAIVSRAFDEMGEEEEVTAGSPLASLLKKLRDGFGVDISTVRQWCNDNDGLRLRAYLHADCQTVRNILAN